MSTSAAELINLIPTLTPAQQDAVAAFIKYLKDVSPKQSISVQEAVEEFMRDHSQILELLAK
jgi:hypothetical protein